MDTSPRSIKTTLCGIATILSALAQGYINYANGQPLQWEILIAQIIAGAGLVAAKDYDATHSVPPAQLNLEVKS